ncbi:putative reverse transcriptase domain-containing protein, partial [Tanacetum coccineum]
DPIEEHESEDGEAKEDEPFEDSDETEPFMKSLFFQDKQVVEGIYGYYLETPLLENSLLAPLKPHSSDLDPKRGSGSSFRVEIMPPRMTTQSAGRPVAASRGGGTGVQDGRGGGRTRGRSGDQSNGGIGGRGGQVSGQGSVVNDGVDGVPDFSTIIAQQLQNLLPTIVAQVGDQGRNQDSDAINDNTKGDVSSLVTPESKRIERYVYGLAPQIQGMVAATEPKTIQKAVQIAGRLTGEALKNRSIKKNPKKRRNVGEPSKDRNVRDDNKRTRTGNAFATTTNPVGRENTGTVPNCTTYNSYHAPGAPCRTCFNSNRPSHFIKDCRVVPRNVNPVNVRNPTAVRGACFECGSPDHYKSACPRLIRAQGPGGNRPNQALANDGGLGSWEPWESGKGKGIHVGSRGSLPGLEHRDGFVSTTFVPLLGIEPSQLGFSYEIEIASGQLVEIDKVIKGCKLEIYGHVFDIDLIPFGSGSFDVIIGIDWLSNHKAEIICHEKVARIPLLDDKVLKVLKERTEEKVRHLMSTKAKEKKQEEIMVVRDFPELFLDDLSGLPPIREIKFWIELILGAVPVAKYFYRLAPSEMEEFSGQLKELQDKVEQVDHQESLSTP